MFAEGLGTDAVRGDLHWLPESRVATGGLVGSFTEIR